MTVRLSFEIFPPAGPTGTENLWRTLDRLVPFGPEFVSVTYGAGGTTQDRTVATVGRVVDAGMQTAAHLTCVGKARREVDAVVDRYVALGARRIVALRGDPPEGSDDGRHPDGYPDAVELVAAIRSRADVQISVAAYPEVHPRAASADADLDNLKRKLDAGADQAITQFFFEAESFLRFRDRARAAGITQPIVPGIMPIGDYGRIRGFAVRCGTSIPAWLDATFAGLDETPEIREMVAADVAAELCRRLVGEGVDCFHVYTLNKAEPTATLCRLLGLEPATPADHERVA